jgi:hypothetical protein
VKEAVACHRKALAGGGVGAGTGSALFRKPPPAGAPPSVTGKKTLMSDDTKETAVW